VRLAYALVLVEGLAVGCGPSSYGDFRDQLVRRACDHAVSCGVIGASERSSCGVPGEIVLTTVGALDVAAAAKAGRLRFSSDGAQSCLDAVKSAPCDPQAYALALELRCHAVIFPAVEVGSACDDDGECVGGQCVGIVGGCPGACVAYAAPGATCRLSGAPQDICDPSVQFCAGTTPTPTCQLHRQEGDLCLDSSECSFGLVCVAPRCSQIPRHAEGDACGSDATLCKDDLYCDPTGHCKKLHTNGDACDSPSSCAAGFACASATCKTWSDIGQPCVDGQCPGSQRCQAGACVSNGTLLAGVGSDCTQGSCAGGLFCDDRSQCAYVVGQLGACSATATGQCAPGLTCDSTQVCSTAVCAH
jgi:hypothetical protein